MGSALNARIYLSLSFSLTVCFCLSLSSKRKDGERFNCARARSLGDISRAFMRDDERGGRDRLIAENDGRRWARVEVLSGRRS